MMICHKISDDELIRERVNNSISWRSRGRFTARANKFWIDRYLAISRNYSSDHRCRERYAHTSLLYRFDMIIIIYQLPVASMSWENIVFVSGGFQVPQRSCTRWRRQPRWSGSSEKWVQEHAIDTNEYAGTRIWIILLRS